MNHDQQDNRVSRHVELGHFIRNLREHTQPETLGLPVGERRRTPGLRREELASLCGISVTWLTWLEQGRDVSASTAALSQMADTLRLDAARRQYLFELAGRPDPALKTPEPNQADRLQRALHEMRCPAYVLDVWWTIRAANKGARQLFANWGAKPRAATNPNLLHYVFLNPLAQDLLVDWKSSAARLVAEFRADLGSLALQPAGKEFIKQLCLESPVFQALWESQQVASRTGGIRQFHHPDRGLVECEQITLRSALDPSLKVVMLMDAASAV